MWKKIYAALSRRG